MSLKLATLAASVANLSISGVTVKDLNEIPEEVTERICPVLYPNPDGFITGLSVSRQSLGADNVSKKNVLFSLNYIYAHAPAGSFRFLAQAQAAMVANVETILEAFTDNSSLSGSVDLSPRLEGEMGMIEDPAGNQFVGCMISLDVLDYYEVS